VLAAAIVSSLLLLCGCDRIWGLRRKVCVHQQVDATCIRDALSAKEKEFEVHADGSGMWVLCQNKGCEKQRINIYWDAPPGLATSVAITSCEDGVSQQVILAAQALGGPHPESRRSLVEANMQVAYDAVAKCISVPPLAEFGKLEVCKVKIGCSVEKQDPSP
jgi:hypothetical protein